MRSSAVLLHTSRNLRPFVLMSMLLLAGCATGPGTIFTPTPKPLPPEETGNYQPVAGRGPELVADLRAAPPPAEPEVADGKSEGTDEKRLGAQSILRVGTSHFAATDSRAREHALSQGQRVGADRMIFYPGADALTVVYYVRFKLPFGATFRDLRETERDRTGADGGVAIGSVVNDSPAARANLLSGDIVLKCDDKAIAGRADFQSCLRARAGHPVNLTIVRNGETIQRMVRLGPLASSG